MITNSKRSLFSALGLVLLVGITYALFQGYILPEIHEELQKEPGHASWLPVLAYILIAGITCLASSIFWPLQSWKKKTLVWAIFWGLVWGFNLGFLLGSATVASGGAKSGTTTMGIIAGLVFCGFFGTVLGLMKEPYSGRISRGDARDW